MTPDELKSRVDLHDLAAKLGLQRPHATGNYRSPHHADKSPSLSIFKDGKAWLDHSSGRGGSCIDLVAYAEECDTGQAIRRVHELMGFSLERPAPSGPPRERTMVEFVADQCLRDPAPAVAYLVERRGIAKAAAEQAVRAGAVGWSTWVSAKIPAGEPLHGGPGAAFVVRTLNPGHVRAVDLRYVDAELNGGIKTKTVGEKDGYPWFVDARELARAHTLVLVESPINALSVASCGLPGWAALAIRGTGNAERIDWAALKLPLLHGKRVVLALDYDQPDHHGRCAGQEAAWALAERLTGLGISALLIDQLDWPERGWNDLNDVLCAADGGAVELKRRLQQFEPWAIPGLPGNGDAPMRRRLFLPPHDFAQYWRYRVEPDFTRMVSTQKDPETGEAREVFSDVAGFRVAAVSRVSIAGATSTMSGDTDYQPTTVFSVSAQTPRHGHTLTRRVFQDDDLHNVGRWQKIGPVFAPGKFARLLSILERSADLGARQATNFVGLAWRDGKAIINEGPDCYFTEPEKQCPYHNLSFPGGTPQDGRRVVAAYSHTFRHSAALQILVWALGGHLKAHLGFWPHMILQADKGTGKSTLVKRLERSIGMTMFGGQSLQTEFRLLTSVSHTSHPVGWEEISARKSEIIDRAVAILQEAYQYTLTRRGSEMTEYLVSAPVLLAGEDVPVRSLTQKTVRAELTGRKGPLMPVDLPQFPVRGWLEFLAGLPKARVNELHQQQIAHVLPLSRARADDEGARRMAINYAAVLTAWTLLREWLEIDDGGFTADLIGEMNGHIADTGAAREPWVWIMEVLAGEIEAGTYRYPHKILWSHDGDPCLFLRTSHVMQHLAHSMPLREFWSGLPIKSDRVFRRQLDQAGVVNFPVAEKTINGQRLRYLVGLSIPKLAQWGVHIATPDAADYQ